MKVTGIRNLSGKVQVIDGTAYKSGEMVPLEKARLPDGRINPYLGPPPDTRARAKRDRGG